jgi:hypothetical protein
MTGIVRIEARHLARSPLLWIGVALAAAVAALELLSVFPVLAGDDLLAYRDGFVAAGGALLAGAWLARRDRSTGAGDLVAVTPTAPWRLWRSRLAAVAAVAAGAFTAVFAAGLAVSAARGGRGVPDLRLLADGALAAVLCGWVGVAVGRLGSRAVPLLVAPLLVGASLLVASIPGVTDRRLSVQRLSPVLSFEQRSAVFGFLPDPFWPHLGYLLGLVLVGGALLLVALPPLAGGRRPPPRSLLAVWLAGLVLVAACGARLVALPDRELVLGPAPSARVAAGFRLETAPGSLDPSFAYPDDGLARSCAGDAAMSVCVYPAYGRRLAGIARRAMQPVVELFAGLPGVPTRVRMVPTVAQGSDLAACRDGEVQLVEELGRYTPPSGPASNAGVETPYAETYLRCALRGPGVADDGYLDHEAAQATGAVGLWALLAGGLVTREEVERALQTGSARFLLPSPASVEVAMAMADLPPDRVRAELAPVWERLRAGALPATELPGQRP